MSDLNLLVLDQRLRDWVQPAAGGDFRSISTMFDAAVGEWYVTAQDFAAPKTLVYEGYHGTLLEGLTTLLTKLDRPAS
jgi:hypothetical protein